MEGRDRGAAGESGPVDENVSKRVRVGDGLMVTFGVKVARLLGIILQEIKSMLALLNFLDMEELLLLFFFHDDD